MKIKHKNFALRDIKMDAEARTVEGWASTFGNTDSGNDIILKGAFVDSLKGPMPKMLWQHNSDQPIGVWDSAAETDQGLFVKGRILDTTLGNDAYKLAQAGAIDSMSIGYSTVDATWDYETGIRTIKKLDLWEVSLVTFPMNDKATITAVKSAAEDIDQAYDLIEQASGICAAYIAGEITPTAETLATVSQLMQQAMSLLGDDDSDEPEGDKSVSPKAIEKILREAGMSRSQAKGLLAKGFTAIAAPREAESEVPKLVNLFNQFKI